MDLKNYYDFGYHGRRHARLIADASLFTACVSRKNSSIFATYLPLRECLISGVVSASRSHYCQARVWDLSRESREISRGRGITVIEELGDVPSDSFDSLFFRHMLKHAHRRVDGHRSEAITR
jgi:hypothetical protein